MTQHTESTPVPAFKDRKVGLIVFGLIQLAIGGLCALMVALMFVSLAVASRLGPAAAGSMNAGMMIPATLIYILAALWFITMGVGSILARRWARALILVSSWIWLIAGIMGLVFALSFMPGMFDNMGESGQIPAHMAASLLVILPSS